MNSGAQLLVAKMVAWFVITQIHHSLKVNMKCLNFCWAFIFITILQQLVNTNYNKIHVISLVIIVLIFFVK